ncbi:MAG: SRPBCC domain-containing protein [Saprospiraceae bacterium]
MSTNPKIEIVKNSDNNTIIVSREYDASVESLWKAWTESELLDQWWAPKPYRAETKTFNFEVDGFWLYAMVGPENDYMWAKTEFKSIKPKSNFQYVDMFCNDQGKRNTDLPSLNWNNDFLSIEDGSKVHVTITFASNEDMQKILKMGFEDGFTKGLQNLEDLLASK